MLHEIIKMFSVRISFLCALMTVSIYSAFSFFFFSFFFFGILFSLLIYLFIHALDTGAFIFFIGV